jgi:hypothetical protein
VMSPSRYAQIKSLLDFPLRPSPLSLAESPPPPPPPADPDLAGVGSASHTSHFCSWSSPVVCASTAIVLEPARWLFRCVLPLNVPWCSCPRFRLEDVDRRWSLVIVPVLSPPHGMQRGSHRTHRHAFNFSSACVHHFKQPSVTRWIHSVFAAARRWLFRRSSLPLDGVLVANPQPSAIANPTSFRSM